MRKSNLFRTLAAVTMLAVVTMSANAQLTTTGAASVGKTGAAFGAADPNYVDIVTVGSKVPYKVDRDANVVDLVTNNPTVFFPSVFSWIVTGAAADRALEIPGAHTALTPDDAANGTIAYGGCFYETDVAVDWKNTGVYTISVAEQSQNNAGFPACADATPENIDVWVMPQPVVSFNESATPLVGGTIDVRGTNTADGLLGACGLAAAATDVVLAVDVTGADQYMVQYKVDYYSLANATAVPTTAGVTGWTATRFDDGTHTYLNLSGATPNPATTVSTNNEIKISVPLNQYGKYIATLTGINDRVSRKSFSNVATPTGTLGATTALTLMVLPTPVTGVIQHVDNNPAVAW